MDAKYKDKLLANRKINGECWEWTGYLENTGYGRTTANGKNIYTHRLSYILFVGEIPEGLHIDHLCRNPKCFNPKHLEPVTLQENHRRSPIYFGNRTQCPKGHPYNEENTRITERGKYRKRSCKKCQIEAYKKHRKKIREQKSLLIDPNQTAEEYKKELIRKSREALLKKYGNGRKLRKNMRGLIRESS